MKAFLSTHTARLAQRTHLGVTGDGHSERCAESDEQHALAELAKILAETEPRGCRVTAHAGGMVSWLGHYLPYSVPSEAACILAESLSALVADGGPLDQLAEVGVIGQLSAIAHRNANVEARA